MEAALQDPPSTSICSDDNEFNSENARLHFGPFKTPERKFAAMVDSPASPTEVISPPPSTSLTIAPADNEIVVDTEQENEESDDVERVEELIGSLLEVDGDGMDDEIPFSADYVDDEPSSALALRISRAADNPSPPPSPGAPAVNLESTVVSASPQLPAPTFDTLITTTPEAQDPSDTPPESRSPSLSPPKDPEMEIDVPMSSAPSPQPDLINLDSFTTLTIPVALAIEGPENLVPDSALSEVDALLLPSPVVDERAMSIEPVLDAPFATSSEDPKSIESTAQGDEEEYLVALNKRLCGLSDDPLSQVSELTPPPSTPPPERQLRRSPRKSVAVVSNNAATPGPSSPRPSSRSPKKKKVRVEEIIPDSQDESDHFAESGLLPVEHGSTTTTPRVKERSRSRSPLVFSREVGSLSPTTANFLTDLIPSFTDTTPIQLTVEPVPLSEPVASSQGMQTFSVFSAPPPEPPSTPKRSTSPIRAIATTPLASPSKLQDPTATPARRITIERALETGQISPLKASQMGFTPNLKTPVPSMPQTPARRVLIADKAAQAPPSARQGLRFGSPVRGRSQEPGQAPSTSTNANASTSSSTVPSFARPTMSTSAHNTASSSSTFGRTSRLPYPLVAAEKPPSVTALGKEAAKQPPSISSPIKSNLKQPTSRIPRIGAKPYTRPTAAAKPTVQKQAPLPPPPAVKPPVMRKVDLSKPSTTRMVGSRAAPSGSALVKANGKETPSIRAVVPAVASTNASSSSVTSAIKRKRSPDKIPSPVKSRMPSSRQAKPTAAKSTTGPSARMVTPGPVKQARTIRKVVDLAHPPVPTPAPAPPQPPNEPEAPPPQPDATEAQFEGLVPPQIVAVASQDDDQLGSPMKEDAPQAITSAPTTLIPTTSIPVPVSQRSQIPTAVHVQPLPIPTIQIDPPMDTPPIETIERVQLQEIQPPSVRRTTRQRKSVSLVDPLANEPSTRPTSSRRKASQGPRFIFTDAYSEMSATALKQLTLTNTTRNQHYLSARLETEVVKRDGLRPESPMVKIKTVAQREDERQAEKRSERARRRARRSGESVPGSSDMESDEEGVRSEDELPSQFPPMAHTRGAGEEEDYKTPDRAFKRMKLTEDGFRDVDMEEKRRVKWDRGLYTTVYLDEIQLGSRQPSKVNQGLKGCLAPSAKALRLDTLGNLGGNDEPLPDIAPQHVTVKKFVYDGEVIEPVVVVEVPPPPVPKATRSKSKKAKS
ncbi:hypothetical protein D9611_004677 [Ephemerocybe angulata]|uniref:Uncharacterized protein n=1 Tax=Ephemerocybe angulata TaxID=980116 RepID=A0A8H5B2V5_9AGAR|nr:hypothetical protein D9611_004677 [Tulosesus angulatus]